MGKNRRSGSRPVGYKGFRQGKGGYTANAALAQKYGAPMMTRGGFMKGLGVAAAGAGAAAVGLGGVAHAQPPTVVPTPTSPPEDDYGYDVYPTNNPDVDLTSVQWAVFVGVLNRLYQGKATTVKLKSHKISDPPTTLTPFNFKGENSIFPFPGVIILLPVTIEGDGIDADSNPKTEINGGGKVLPPNPPTPAFPFPALTVFPGLIPTIPYIPGEIKIDGLWIRGATFSAIGGYNWSTLKITNNMVTELNTYPIPEGTMDTPMDLDIRFSIICKRLRGPVSSHGTLTIDNNVVDNQNYLNPGFYGVSGEVLISAAGISDELNINNNTLRGHGYGIGHYLNIGNDVSSTISGNTIEITPYPSFLDQHYLGISCLLNDGDTFIKGNTITSPLFGIAMSNQTAEIYKVSGNTFNMNSGMVALHMGDPHFSWSADAKPLCGAEIKDNTITGTAEYGIAALDFPETPWGFPSFYNESNDNDILGNDLSAFHATKAQVYLAMGAHHNYFGPDEFDNPNSFGEVVHPPAGRIARIIIEGYNNHFEYNEYVGTVYPWEAGHGIWLLTEGSAENTVTGPVVPGAKLSVDKYWRDDNEGTTGNQLII